MMLSHEIATSNSFTNVRNDGNDDGPISMGQRSTSNKAFSCIIIILNIGWFNVEIVVVNKIVIEPLMIVNYGTL